MAGCIDLSDKSDIGRSVCRYRDHCSRRISLGDGTDSASHQSSVLSDVFFTVTETGKGVGNGHRLTVAFGVTDEIFGVSASQEGRISPWYNYGVMCVAIPGWTLGTLAGAISGNLLPDFLVSALSVAIYGMFLAVIIPPAKKNRAVLGVVIGAMAVSTLFATVPVLNKVSTGFVIIITTVLVAGIAAYFCPIEEKKEAD